MPTPDITVIIPTHNRPRMLQRALASALAQVGPSFEVLVVDDGEGQGIAHVEAVGSPLARALSSGRQGQVPARRIGVGAAQGAMIAFLDDDDWWADRDHLARLMAARPAGPALTYASGMVVIEDQEMRKVEEMPFDAAATPESLTRDNTLLVSAILYDRSLHAALGEFDVAMPYYWDWDWYLRLAAAGIPFVASGGSAARISARLGSVSSDANVAARRADLDRLEAKHGLAPIPLRNHESIARDRQADPAVR